MGGNDMVYLITLGRTLGVSKRSREAARSRYVIMFFFFQSGLSGTYHVAESFKHTDCLANLAQPNDLFHSLLLHKIKPVFASAPHPDVNHETGRKLSVPAGGARARLDRFNEQSWKQASEYGIVNALRGCLQRMTVGCSVSLH